MFGVIFSWNYFTFFGIKSNTGYTYGKIIKVWESGKHRHHYSRYEYKIKGITYQGKQGDNFSKENLVVVVYDKENPQYSMIADYPFKLLNDQKDTLKINTEYVYYSWWDYLPADNISDLWTK